MTGSYVKFGLLLLSVYFGFVQISRPDDLLAQVENRQISVDDYIYRYRDYLRKTGLTDNLKLRHEYFNYLIDESAILEHVYKSAIINESSLQSIINNKKEQLYIDYFYEKYLYSQLNVTEPELREAFRRSNIKIHARHLFARTLEEAYQIKRKLDEGNTFEALAAEIFKDPTLAMNGGDLGWFSYDEMDPNFEDAVYTMQVGEISEPVKTNDGYSIIEVLDIAINPIITEDLYNTHKKWLELQVKRRKHTRFVEMKTDEILAGLRLRFNEKGMDLLFEQFPKIRQYLFSRSDLTEINIKPLNAEVLRTKNGKWTLRYTIGKLNELNKSQWDRIRDRKDLEDAITGLVIREEIERQIAEKGLISNPEVRELEKRKQDDIILKYIVEKISDTLTIDEKTLCDYYEAHRDQFMAPAEFEIAEIVLKDTVIAGAVFDRLLAGEDFAELAKTYSQNERSSGNGGYLGWAKEEELGILSPYIVGAQKDDLLGPLRYYDKYIILKVLDIKQPERLSYQQAKEQIIQELKPQAFLGAYRQFIDTARANLKIVTNINRVDNLNIDI